jgi:hypothetical protein
MNNRAEKNRAMKGTKDAKVKYFSIFLFVCDFRVFRG